MESNGLLAGLPGMADGGSLAFKMTPGMILKSTASFILSTLGFFYLSRGRKNNDVGAMIQGAFLVLLSMFLFF